VVPILEIVCSSCSCTKIRRIHISVRRVLWLG
jgi:hypothetical protein